MGHVVVNKAVRSALISDGRDSTAPASSSRPSICVRTSRCTAPLAGGARGERLVRCSAHGGLRLPVVVLVPHHCAAVRGAHRAARTDSVDQQHSHYRRCCTAKHSLSLCPLCTQPQCLRTKGFWLFGAREGFLLVGMVVGTALVQEISHARNARRRLQSDYR